MGSDLSRRAFMTAVAGGAAACLGGAVTRAQAGAPAARTVRGGVEEPAGDLVALTIRDASELIRRRKLSPVELTRAYLTRIERLNPSLNAFITVMADAALAEARAAEADVQRGSWRGPLHGIPIALKDLFDTAGVRTTAGSGVFKDRVPSQDAEVVRRLKTAGAVLVGKANMHEFAFGGSSLVSYFGGVRNAWDRARIAGGSSGGSATAVAAELCAGALGSDTAASIRQPAAYCGIVGLKPTYGLVSTRGVIPLSWSFDHVGPLARTVADTALILRAIAGYDPEDVTSVRMDVPNYAAGLERRPASVRLGIARDFFFDSLDPEIEAATTRAIAALEKLTAGVTEVVLPARGQEELRAAIRVAEASTYHADFMAKTPDLYQPETLARLRGGADVTTTAYIRARQQLELTRRSVGQAFANVDAIVTPTSPILPPPIAEFSTDRNGSPEFVARNIRNTSPFNV
jgi:aspartyl-tRNA(Asn)/glutamyl-tRNA(Gln) amidotransferase subunit A